MKYRYRLNKEITNWQAMLVTYPKTPEIATSGGGCAVYATLRSMLYERSLDVQHLLDTENSD